MTAASRRPPSGEKPGPRARKPAAPRRATAAPGSGKLRPLDLLALADRGEFPATIYLEGPCEPLKAALLAELKAAWRRHVAPSPARVFRAAESGVEDVLGAFQGGSLFDPRELLVVLDVEDWGRGEKRLGALAQGLALSGGATCLVLVESAADAPRKALGAVRDACQVRVESWPPMQVELSRWGARRLAREGLEAEAGVVDALVEACEGDALAFWNELDKLCAYAGGSGRVTREDAATLLRPVVSADLPEFLAAVALGRAGPASQRLGRVLAGGVTEGATMWALANLVGGALGGWARHPNASETLRRRATPAGLSRALDAVYRAEAAWKGGRADPVAALEQATREVCAAR